MKAYLESFSAAVKNQKLLRRFIVIIFFVFLIFSFLYVLGVKPYPDNKKILLENTFTFDQNSHTAGYGANASRIDSQITLSIPEERTEEVYEYLRTTYIDSAELMKQKFPELEIKGQNKIDISEFTDEYYDSPNLDLDKSLNSARYRSRINTTNAADPKSGRELVQVKATPIGQFDLRTELKFKVETNVLSQENAIRDDLAPLLKKVDKSQRGDFKKALQKIGINPYNLHHIFTIHQTRSRVYIDLNGKNFLSFSIDVGGARKLFTTGKFSSVDIGLVEDVYTPASEKERDVMWAIRDFMVADLKNKFPELKETTESKYSIVLDQIRNKIPYFDFAFKLNLI